MADPTPTARAHGRSLTDFAPLSAAEQKLLACARSGAVCELDDERPEEPTKANTIRAGLIRFLALGGDDANPVHEAGVQLLGAWVNDQLDLTAAIATRQLDIKRSRFEKPITAERAHLPAFHLGGSYVPGIVADGCIISDCLFLRDGFCAKGEVSLIGAKIRGNFECTGGMFENGKGSALSADGISVGGGVFLHKGFSALGEVSLSVAQIGGGLFCGEGRFENVRGRALTADGIKVAGDVILNNHFKAKGAVRLLSAQISGNLDCSGGRFENAGGDALIAQGATVKGSFFFRRVTIVKGWVDLNAAHVGSLADDAASWPENALILDGFAYDRIATGATDAATRIAWLNKQYPRYLNEDFRPQPWEQLIKVLREMGHGRDANEVAIAKQHALRAAKKIGTRRARTDFRYGWRRWLDRLWNGVSNFVARRFHDIYGLLAGYGYRPVRILLWVLGLWLASGLAFHEAAMMGKMAPSNPILYAHEAGADVDVTTCGVIGDVDYSHYWVRCAGMPAEYTTFSPLGYAADMILPLVNLQQDTEWGPVVSNAKGPLYWGVVTRWLGWLDIVLGWLASLMFVAIVSRLVEKD